LGFRPQLAGPAWTELDELANRLNMRFNCKFREEFLKMNWFTDRSDAKMVIEYPQRPD